MNSNTLFCALSYISKQSRIPNIKLYIIAKDELDLVDFTSGNNFIICQNTAIRSHKGQHWLIFYCRKNKTKLNCLYFDSYGKPLSFYNIKFPILVNCRNFKSLQCLSSSYCGHYCVYFIFNLLIKKISFKTVLNHFSVNCERNDQIVSRFFEKFFFKIYYCIKNQKNQTCVCWNESYNIK